MKKSLFITTIITALLLSGCGKKTPDMSGIDAGKNNISDVTQIAGKTVTIDDDPYANGTPSGHANATDINNMNSGKFNTSNDGFQSIYFGFGAYDISADMQDHVNTNTLTAKNSQAKIKIEGNCDEFGTDEYNYALGLKRAKAVKDSIVAQGMNASQMYIISFGESNPVCSNPTDSCYAQNRRVDLRLAQ
ncbi:MAG: Outer membrane lipoprotein omp16 precursor [uncultured Sulfurovum sp.]|uniref:Outer membrane lipoprotein omp16 n=1 Tax=uncultured Sulfurovum sp. TaxID=269237 RepID=A0A6S6RW35_9BACT|nr:MAG: Outer membrane lipoprotein omp16 precursor [uncultured Sulfurovum sp.]